MSTVSSCLHCRDVSSIFFVKAVSAISAHSPGVRCIGSLKRAASSQRQHFSLKKHQFFLPSLGHTLTTSTTRNSRKSNTTMVLCRVLTIAALLGLANSVDAHRKHHKPKSGGGRDRPELATCSEQEQCMSVSVEHPPWVATCRRSVPSPPA